MLAQKLIIFTQTLRKYVELFHIITSQLSIRKKKKKKEERNSYLSTISQLSVSRQMARTKCNLVRIH